MGVDQAQALEAPGRAPLPPEGRDHQALVIPDDDLLDGALAVDEHPQLAPEFPRNFRQLAGQFGGDD